MQRILNLLMSRKNVSLPTSIGSPADCIEQHQVSAQARSRDSILLIDDDAESSELLAVLLIANGVRVDRATSAIEALQMIRVSNDYFVALIDQNLGPHSPQDGPEIGRIALQNGIPYVFGYTGANSAEARTRWRDNGAVEVLTKPLSYGQILQKIRALP